MKSVARKCLFGLMLLAALAVTVRFAAQERPQGSTSAEPGIANPVPLVNQPLIPDTTMPGGTGFQLTVNGTGFVSGSVVDWNGSARTTTFISGSQVTANILASDIASARTASVTVVNPPPGGGTSNVVFFPVALPVSVSFGGSVGFSVGSSPASEVTGDFNGDGKLDLAVANFMSNNISILLGNGDGTFRAAMNYGTAGPPLNLAVGDFNGDGKLDLAVPNTSSNNVSILLGNGDGTFQAAVNYAVGTNPNSVAVGDFNGDGKLDLVVTNDSSNNVSVLLGNGDGTFQPAVNYASGGSPIGGMAVGDFNRDGKLDFAVAVGPFVSVFLGNGDGTFQAAVNYTVGSNSHGVATGDFNGDGKLDLAVVNNTGNDVSILLGNGDGTFQSAVNYGAGAGPNSIELGDFNEDGKLDLVVADDFTNTVSVLLGNGDGTFQPAVSYTAGSEANWAALGDFNGDGRLDLAIADVTAGVNVLLQNGSLAISPPGVNFGIQLLGGSSPTKNVTLTNLSGGTLTISGITITGTDPADFSETNNCGASLPPGGHCTVGVTFTPVQLGSRSAALTITDSAPGSPQSVPLSGSGVTSGPNATLSTNSLTFATQLVNTTSPPQPVMLSNYGTVALLITAVGTSGDFNQSNTCGKFLLPLASCTINVTFTPTTEGNLSGMLSITDNAPGSPQTVSLTGVGTVVELNPASLSFGTVTIGQRKTLTTTMTNVGSTTLSITSIVISGTYFSQTNNCPLELAAQNSCNISVTFAPEGAGTFNGVVSISDNGGGSPQQVSLSGTGRQRCSGSCTFGRFCGSGCHCDKGVCVENSDLLNELLLDWNPAASFACGSN